MVTWRRKMPGLFVYWTKTRDCLIFPYFFHFRGLFVVIWHLNSRQKGIKIDWTLYASKFANTITTTTTTSYIVNQRKIYKSALTKYRSYNQVIKRWELFFFLKNWRLVSFDYIICCFVNRDFLISRKKNSRFLKRSLKYTPVFLFFRANIVRFRQFLAT